MFWIAHPRSFAGESAHMELIISDLGANLQLASDDSMVGAAAAIFLNKKEICLDRIDLDEHINTVLVCMSLFILPAL